MFYYTRVSYIKMLATDISADRALYGWVYDVSPTGIFVKNKDATWDVRGINGIPEGWIVATEEQELIIPTEDGYGELTEEQASFVVNYCRTFPNNYSGAMSELEGFYLTFNGLTPARIQFNKEQGIFGAEGENFQVHVQADFGYILIY